VCLLCRISYCVAALPGTYTAPLLRHGCAELASAQYTFPAERVFPLSMTVA